MILSFIIDIKNEFSKSHHRTDSLVKLNENSSSKLNLSKSVNQFNYKE